MDALASAREPTMEVNETVEITDEMVEIVTDYLLLQDEEGIPYDLFNVCKYFGTYEFDLDSDGIRRLFKKIDDIRFEEEMTFMDYCYKHNI